MDRFSEYRIMWVLVCFDLPTDTKIERRAAALFRKRLMADGFDMFQFSIYIRHCANADNADTHVRRIKGILPEKGQVMILKITDKQFGDMEVFNCQKKKECDEPVLPFEFF